MVLGRAAWIGVLGVLAWMVAGSAATASASEPAIAASPMAEALTPRTILPQEAIARIESLERNYRTLRWKAHSVEVELRSAADTKSVASQRKDFQDSQVLFDPMGRRYCMAIQAVNSIDGRPPFLASVAGYSFDGEVYRGWQRSKLGDQLPAAEDDLPARGGIAKDRKNISQQEDPVTLACVATGLGHMPPYFWDGESPCQPLSALMRKWLEAKRDFSIVEDYRGVWTIRTTVTIAGNEGCRLQIRFDPERGGVVTGARWSFAAAGNCEIEHARLEVELQQVGDDVWMPKIVRRVLSFEMPPTMTLTTFEDVEVNPTAAADAFRVTFPKGVRVADHIRGTTFVAGEGGE